MKIRQIVVAATLALGLVPSVHAEPVQMTTTVGHWIAAQGNAALRELRDDMKKELERSLQPPAPAAPAAPAADMQPRDRAVRTRG